jgi:hypothetical protein
MVPNGFIVSYHTSGNWIATTPQGKEITFHCKENGMCHGFPYINMHSTNAAAMIRTVCQHYEGYTMHKVQNAIPACKAQAMIGHPTDAQFLYMVRSNTLKNCPIKPAHIANTLTIFGPSAAGVHRKTVHHKPEQVEAEPGCIPDNFHRFHKFVVLTTDVMFVNSMAFLITLSRKFWLATIENLPTCMTTQLSNSLTKIVRLYACTGFITRVIMIDQEFDKVEDANEMVEINTTAASEHVGEIKWYICAAKERSRALLLDLSFTLLPRQVIIHLVYIAVLWLNSLPAAAGVSKKYPPCKIVLGHELNFTKHCKATFGSYVDTHDHPTITNTMHLCKIPGIFLGPTGDCQGTHKVFDINTGVVKNPV